MGVDSGCDSGTVCFACCIEARPLTAGIATRLVLLLIGWMDESMNVGFVIE